jgi:leucyl aminopeptidase
VTVERFDHLVFPQKSIIARMQGTGDDQDGVVILSAHFDSTAGGADPAIKAAPGADDDASGIVILYETLRILLAHGFKPSKSILFIGFAAEEGGLFGSTDLVDRYFNQGEVPVFAQLQSEMNGWKTYGEIFILQDSSLPRYLDINLGNFLKVGLISTPVHIWRSPHCLF